MSIHNASKWFAVARTENDELSVYGTFVIPPCNDPALSAHLMPLKPL